MPHSTAILELARTIQETCSPHRSTPLPRLPTGWTDIDTLLTDGPNQGLPAGVIHEWFGLFDPPMPDSAASPFQAMASSPGYSSNPNHWLPPLTLMIHLARRAEGPVVWIGRRCWPYPIALGPSLLDRSIFIDVLDLRDRAWALDVSLRCRGLGVVIGDGAALNMSATRRLQLAAAEGNALALILRPPRDLSLLSAAHTRWTVSPQPSPATTHRWTLRLLRLKGLKLPDHDTWTLELNETGALHLVPHAPDRSGAETRQETAAHTA